MPLKSNLIFLPHENSCSAWFKAGTMTTNNPKISDFKMYAIQASNSYDSYNNYGGVYALEIVGIVGAIPFANAIAAVAAGGIVVWTAYQGYSAWSSMNQAMANAYSLL